jgi:hypothetical protein
MTPLATPERYKHHRFPAEIISHGVWLYYCCCFSYRDVEALLFVRGILVTYEAIRPTRQWERRRQGFKSAGTRNASSRRMARLRSTSDFDAIGSPRPNIVKKCAQDARCGKRSPGRGGLLRVE